MESLQELRKVLCPKCQSNKFKVVTNQLVYDVTNPKGSWKEDYTDLTIESEKLLEVVCAKCGHQIVQSFVKKPIPQKDWDEFWDSYLVDYIMGFEHHVVNRELEDEDDKEEAFLRGVAKGMWAVYNLVESMMVQEARGQHGNS